MRRSSPAFRGLRPGRSMRRWRRHAKASIDCNARGATARNAWWLRAPSPRWRRRLPAATGADARLRAAQRALVALLHGERLASRDRASVDDGVGVLPEDLGVVAL